MNNLVRFGIASSGIVFSTVGAASNLDFKCVAIKACDPSQRQLYPRRLQIIISVVGPVDIQRSAEISTG
jgi:hypothetical protein